jgi:transcriptional regulator with XRE-family HTH domain
MASDRSEGRRDSIRTRWDAQERARELGERIRERRKALGISQEQLGERAGLHRTYVGQVERGDVNVTVRTLLAVADGLGVDVADLVRGMRRANDP